MKKYIKTLFISTILALFIMIGAVGTASAYVTPSLSLVNLDNGYYKVTVRADPSSPVSLYYYVNSMYPQNIGSIGSTDYNGNLTTNISNSQYNIPYGAYVYVRVNDVSSPNITWPYYSNYNNNYQNNYQNNYSGYYNYPNYNGNYYQNYNNVVPITLSQNGLKITNGQNTSLTIYGNGTNYYISQNSNSQVATGSINGSTLSVYGNNAGSTDITICQNTGESCAILNVVVTNNNSQYYYQYGQSASAYNYNQPFAMQYQTRNIFPKHFSFWHWRIW